MSRNSNRADLCTPALVAAAVKNSRGAVALSHGEARLSYVELDRQASQLAGRLVSLGVHSEVPVGICLERSFDYIVAALAVWKAGGAYLPLDPGWPEARRQFVLNDAQAAVVIRRGAGSDAQGVVDLDRDKNAIARATPPADPGITPGSLAYIIYTSGSTGHPKGVEVTHGNLRNLISWHCRVFGVTASDCGSHLAGLAFDASVWEIWPYLSAGASIALADDITRASPEALRDWLVTESVTISFVPTALAEQIVQSAWPGCTKLRYLLTGADTLHRFPVPGLPFQFVNNYGPTECTVVATSGMVASACASGGTPSIGKAIDNTEIYLLDDRLRPVPNGEVGEIYIGGASVARGYRNNSELTVERFLPDPFSTSPGARMYRSGDRGSILPDGQIAFHGRADNQQKIRGYRVEPDEIVSVLKRHKKVASAAVTVSRVGSDPQLTAYVVPAAGQTPLATELREALARDLPEYMIPAAFVRMTALPLTANGKVDLAALPNASAENNLDVTPYRAPETQIEIQVAAILAQLLRRERIGLEDNFFLLGASSLLGAQLIVRVRDRFGTQLSLRDLFRAPTVQKLAQKVEAELIANLDQMSDEEASRMLAEQGAYDQLHKL
jgi:amino acid adenylation domain-containing protein